MKALTLRQPWPWAVLAGGCDVITLHAPVTAGYRGPVALSAAANLAGAEDHGKIMALTDVPMPTMGTPGNVAAMGDGILGVVDVRDSHHADDCFLFDHRCSTWAGRDGWHVQVENPRTLTRKVPATGKSGLWALDTATLALIEGGQS